MKKVEMKNLLVSIVFLLSLLSGCQKNMEKDTVGAAVNTGHYQEPHRPQFHFTPEKMWMNDPNGMVYYEGEYHLFYQHYPDGTVWGPMHWGHAVSRDLVNWKHLPIALYPDSLGYIFSGSAVVDWNNTSGLGEDGQPPLIAIFTHHDDEKAKAGRRDFQYQSIAYSNDRGRSWTKYAGNPVVPNTEPIRDFRDPKVIWDEASQQWVMVFAAKDHVQLWGSPNLKKWTHLSNFGKEWGSHGGVWECPDLFPMQVDNSGETKWVLLLSINPGGPNGGSATQYFVGDFNGKAFILDPSFAPDVSGEKAVWLDYGRDNYAGVTWSDIPEADGRRIFMGWMSNWDYANVVPTGSWRSAMTLPRTLTLENKAAGLRLFAQPVQELEKLRGEAFALESQTLSGERSLGDGLRFSPSQMEVILEAELPEGVEIDFGIALSNSKGEEYRIGYDAAQNQFYSDRTKAGKTGFSEKFAAKRHTAPRMSTDRTLRLHLFFDVASCELFADEGEVVMTDIFFPSEDFSAVKLYAKGGEVELAEASIYPLRKAVFQ